MKKEIVVNAPPEKVFSYLADFPKHSEWAAHRLKIEQTSQGAIGVGTTFKSLGHQMGKNNENQVTITELVPNQRLVFEAEGAEGRFRHLIAVEATGSGTKITKGTDMLRLSLPSKLMLPMIMVMGSGLLAGDLKRIKAKVE